MSKLLRIIVYYCENTNKVITELRLIKGKYYFDNFYSSEVNKPWFYKYNLTRKINQSWEGKPLEFGSVT